MAKMVARIEQLAHARLPAAHIPRGWRLNTCLVNYYGDQLANGKREDLARGGAHRDHEPGPVASVSLGERAYFQFLTRDGRIVRSDWLTHGSLQLFSGPTWKDRFFHRVQRVERKAGARFDVSVDDFAVRSVNLTFRYVPDAFVAPLDAISATAREDVWCYATQLRSDRPFWAAAVRACQPGE